MGFKIEQGEKFALLAFSGLTIGIDDQTPDPADLGFSCWASVKLPFSLNAWWREQLGKVVSEQLDTLEQFGNDKERVRNIWGSPLDLSRIP